MARWNSCNVLQTGPEARLWQFDSRKGEFVLNREHALDGSGSPPVNVVNKAWSSIWQPKLNVAWLPPDNVFFRVVHLPKSAPEETLSMVELQLEKLSPIPVTQVVWSLQPLTQLAEGLQTVIVIFAERKAVEEFLGKLEGRGFLADRLELPALDQLLATSIKEDGAWIYPGAWGGPNTALVAWWYGGVLRNITFISRAGTGDSAAGFKEQLSQTVWAGELEGWLTSPPTWHLVVDATAAAEWEPALRQGLNEPVVVTAPQAPAGLAALTANRAARPETKTNLLPPEFSRRYQQQFVDRLWIHGLTAVGVVYIVCVLIYFAVVGVVAYQVRGAEKQVASLSGSYTNAIQLKARYQVLKERQELKFAALDCWKSVAELMPETLTLESFTFSDGHVLRLNGTAPKDGGSTALEFNEAMRKATVNGQRLFTDTGADSYTFNTSPGAATGTWKFGLELIRVLEQ